MRGGSLSDAKVIDALRPYLVTAWSGRCGDDMPDSIRAIFREAKLRDDQNLLCIVLDSEGRYVRSFHPWSNRNLHEMRFDAARMAAATLAEIQKTSKLLKLPPPAESRLNLPDIEKGVRIFIKVDGSKDPIRQYRAPIVEVAPMSDAERALFAKSGTFDASEVSWLKLVYPAAVMDGKGGMDGVEGKWTVSGGTITGDCTLRLDNRAGTVIRLKVEGTVKGDRIRLAMRGIFPKSRGDGVAEMPMTVYVESRPE